jgi:hypothetical protein
MESRRLSWWCGYPRVQEYSLSRYLHTSKSPAPMQWQMELGKCWCFTMPRPLYQLSNSRDTGVIFLPRPRKWPQIIPDLQDAGPTEKPPIPKQLAKRYPRGSTYLLDDLWYLLSLKTGSTKSLNYQEMAMVLWQQSGIWTVYMMHFEIHLKETECEGVDWIKSAHWWHYTTL